MTFGNWPEDLHRESGQVRKRESAQKVTLDSIDPVAGTAIAIGSGKDPYNVSLERCDCGSFNDKKPCKHMYRLAFELGLIEDTPKLDRAAAKAFKESIPSEIKRFEELYFSGAIKSDKYDAIIKALKK